MKIRFNNFLKLKTKEKNMHRISEERLNDVNVIEENKIKEPVFKVYTKDKIIKYDIKGNTSKNTSKGHVIENKQLENEEIRKVKKRRKYKNKDAHFLFLAMIVLACYSVYFSYNKYKNSTEEDYAVYNSEDTELILESVEEQSSISNNLDTIEKEVEQQVSTKVNSTKENKTQVAKVEPLQFAKPLDGEVLKIYSKDKVIYSKTLELWKTHDGIDIKADENTIVKAIEKGTVEKIYDDSFYGKTIVIDHGQGYKSSYSNLSEEVFVKEKQVVTKLAKIGKVGKTAIGEIKDESHLHFTLLKNNEICDPSSIFK